MRHCRERSFGPDRLHGSPLSQLPPVAQRWRQLHARLTYLRSQLNQRPKTHPRWSRWYDEAAKLLELRKELIPPMRAAGFCVFKKAGGTPLESFRTLQQQQFLEQEQHFAATDDNDWDAIYAAWDAVYAGIDSDSLPRVKRHTPDSTTPAQ